MKAKALLRWIGRGTADALFPPICAGCNMLGREPFCPRCSEALMPAPPLFITGADAAWACLTYGGPIAVAIQRLKYAHREDLGRSLGPFLRAALAKAGPIDQIVPIPLAPARLRRRGYNQALELARGLGTCTPNALRRKDGPAQVGLKRADRLHNASGSFYAPARMDGRRVALIDDVVTTGATARAAVGALREAGAAHIVFLALAAKDDRSTV